MDAQASEKNGREIEREQVEATGDAIIIAASIEFLGTQLGKFTEQFGRMIKAYEKTSVNIGRVSTALEELKEKFPDLEEDDEEPAPENRTYLDGTPIK